MSENAREVLAKATWYWEQRDSEPTQRMPELVGHFERLAFCEADSQLAALADAGLAVVPVEPTDQVSSGGICHACQREVDRVRGSMWHGKHKICLECFYQWYDPDDGDVDPTSAISVGNATRRKLGLPLLTEPPTT